MQIFLLRIFDDQPVLTRTPWLPFICPADCIFGGATIRNIEAKCITDFNLFSNEGSDEGLGSGMLYEANWPHFVQDILSR